jgi:hypothetical protein
VLQVPVRCARIGRRDALEFILDTFPLRRVSLAAQRSYRPALWIEGLLVTTWRRRLRCLERGEVMRFGLFSGIDSGRPTPVRPCISGARALTRLSSELLQLLRAHVPQEACSTLPGRVSASPPVWP